MHLPCHVEHLWSSLKLPGPFGEERKNKSNGERFVHISWPIGCPRQDLENDAGCFPELLQPFWHQTRSQRKWVLSVTSVLPYVVQFLPKPTEVYKNQVDFLLKIMLLVCRTPIICPNWSCLSSAKIDFAVVTNRMCPGWQRPFIAATQKHCGGSMMCA